MRTLLVLLFTLYVVCMLSGCRTEGSYYHTEHPYGKVKGHVTKITDTIYSTLEGEIRYPLRISEYLFDSLQRLVEEHHSYYYTERNRDGVTHDTSIESSRVVKNRYDRNGRKVEITDSVCVFAEDQVETTTTFMRLTNLKGNREAWELTSYVYGMDKEPSPAMKINYLHEKNRLTLAYTNDDNEEECLVSTFDNKGNMIEFRIQGKESAEDSIKYTYKYNADDLIIEKATQSGETIIYRYDEFDNDGNWLKLTELYEDKTIRNITRRKIAYHLDRSR